MKRILLVLALMFGQGSQQPAPVLNIPIENPAFEQGATGWDFGNSSGVTQSGSGVPVAWAGYGGTFSQTLAINPKTVQAPSPGQQNQYVTDGVYTLTFYVTNYFGVYPDYWNAELDFGTQELCKSSFWVTQKWNQITLTCPSPGYLIIDHSLDDNGNSGPVQSDKNFVLTLTGGGWPALFDNVSLSFTPN